MYGAGNDEKGGIVSRETPTSVPTVIMMRTDSFLSP